MATVDNNWVDPLMDLGYPKPRSPRGSVERPTKAVAFNDSQLKDMTDSQLEAAKHEVMSKREFEAASRHYRRGGVTTIDEAIQDFGQDNRLEIKDAHAGTSPSVGKDQKKR